MMCDNGYTWDVYVVSRCHQEVESFGVKAEMMAKRDNNGCAATDEQYERTNKPSASAVDIAEYLVAGTRVGLVVFG